MKHVNKIPTRTLNDGAKIPQIGLGLWQVADAATFDTAFHAAIAAGYRHFDSAQFYRNEHMLGSAWKASGIDRKQLFLTTKISIDNFSRKRTLASFENSLVKLQTDYVDLLLLHFPVSILRKKAWSVLEQLQSDGRVRSIGVSNYTIRHLEEMKKYTAITPAVNQVELHVFLQQPELIAYCKERGIVIEAYSPLAHGKKMDDPLIASIAAKHDKSYAQIMLRWCIENDLVVLPKSVSPQRIQENIASFDFALDQDDLEKMTGLNCNLRTCWNPTLVP
jgi:diketogulonate reductase-like aldo/keto reductase